jgi:hypothetical protein
VILGIGAEPGHHEHRSPSTSEPTDASGWRSIVRMSIARLDRQPGQCTSSHGMPAITAQRIVGDHSAHSVPCERRAGHYLGLRFRGGVPADLPAQLAAQHVHVSVRGAAMRVTPHLWTTDADVERLFAVLRGAVV